MEAPNPGSGSSRPKLHPLIATAAVAVILFAVVGIGAMVMDRSRAEPSPNTPLAAAQTEQAPPVNESQTAAEAARPAPAPAPTRVAAAPPVSSVPRNPQYDALAQPQYSAPPPVAQAPVCRDCGVVDSIRDIKVKGEGTGIGAVGGAVVGGLLGNMVGAGRGKALATVGGAVAGGFGGNAIEKNVRSDIRHQMIVRLDNGGTRTFTQTNPFPYSIGERVRIVDGRVERA